MKLKVCWVGKTKQPAVQALTDEYIKRIGRYLPVETCELRSEAALLQLAARERTRPLVVLLDSRGRQLSSEDFAGFLCREQDHGAHLMILAVGPADGWSDATRAVATHQLSLGRMTLAHEVARIVLLEQLYRALTIIAGHPYHTGH